ncbi:tyrosine-protein phosphatase [Arthrobacter cavernae]|uniref:Tyrosine-protein phosphatase n=1 Tax=Arthrobacter cavernae TaxID=2817681 RepID=A0A939KMB0_9MICC|nr:tyrosine-protein phosphatase [Arthrobacter cavernae]MBO1268108.1 tyrosine-protein phosphatase [Arthrobacter cavernae]
MTVLNLRPLAGGRILRGSQPFGLDAVSAAGFLAAHGIQTVMDLRSEYERAMVPWLIPNGGSDAGTSGPAGPAVPAAAVELVENPFDPHTAAGGLQSIETPQDLGELYLGWVRSRPEWVADALRPVAQGRRTLIHCSLGKDRTGVVSALALLLAGEHPDAVVADYTATTANLPEMLHIMADTWRLHVPSTPSQFFSPDLMILQAPEAAMRHFLAGFAREFGDARGFLREAGLTAVEVSALGGPGA